MIADDLRAGRAEDAGQVELGKELRLGDADLRVGADQLLFDLSEVGPALEQGGGQSGRHRRDDGLSVHRRAAWNRRGRLAEKDADLVLLRDDLLLELGDVRLRPAQRPLGPSGLEVGGQPEPQAILEQVVGALERLGAVARDLELHVQREQLEVRLSQVADQRQPHAAPRLLGGQQVRARGLAGSADAPPDVQLPLGGERPQEEVRRGVLRHLGRDPERGHGVATAGHGEVVADLREELRARHPDAGRAPPVCGRRRSSRRSCWRAPPGSGSSGWGPRTPPTTAGPRATPPPPPTGRGTSGPRSPADACSQGRSRSRQAMPRRRPRIAAARDLTGAPRPREARRRPRRRSAPAPARAASPRARTCGAKRSLT